ncbi:PEGA domain-containing protein [Polyangium sorediatum]|uniref:PEGA domain-containing protein n=1 Tax=Polyangium sorediatum TaxID=889274 RepID=A0ABT6NSJ2_9BACT|nr:PEGA domain-containing protein [Polyangium sorediatum]MDI1431120.1 PEGA domain-containing protein [Polyangium sorediatum]
METSAKRGSLAALLCSLFIGACAPSVPATVSLRVKGNAPDASVTIDDMYIGALAFVAKRGVALPPGKHRITVEKPGFFPWDKLVEAREGDPPIHLDVGLVKIPD